MEFQIKFKFIIFILFFSLFLTCQTNKNIQENDQNSLYYYNLAYKFSIKEMYDEAIEYYTKAINLNPKFDSAYINRGVSYFLKGIKNNDNNFFQKAIEDYTLAIDINPKIIEAYVDRAIVYDNLKLYNEAILDYSKAIEINPDFSSEIYYYRGNIYNIIGSYEESINDCSYAIKLNNKNLSAYECRGNNYLILREYNKSINDYDMCIKLNSYNYIFFLRLFALFKQNKTIDQDSLQLIKDGIDKFNERDKIIANYILGNYSIEDILSKVKDDKYKLQEAYFYIGCNFLYKNNIENAKKNFENIIKIKIEESLISKLAKLEYDEL